MHARHRLSSDRVQAVYPSFSLCAPPAPAGPPSGAARHIGRIGALAVALGVGAALATGHGTARADDGSDSSGSGASTESSSTAAATADTAPAASSDSEASGETGPPSGPSVPEMNVSSSGGAHTSTSGEADPEPDDNEDEDDDEDVDVDVDADVDVDVDADADAPTVEPDEDSPATRTAEPPVRQNDPPPPPPRQTTAPRPAPASEDEPVVAPVRENVRSHTPEPVVTQLDPPTVSPVAPVEFADAPEPEEASVAATLLAAAIAPFVLPGPGVPAASPLLWAVMAWTRREIERTEADATSDTAASTSLLGPNTLHFAIAEDSILSDRLSPTLLSLVPTIVAAPLNGALNLSLDGNFTYTPRPNFHGDDAFTVSFGVLGIGLGQTVTVNITVTPVNDPPVSTIQNVAMDENTSHSGRLPAATDADGDPITYSVVTEPTHGTVAVDPGGDYTYTPDAGYFGRDSFMFSVADPYGGRAYYTVFFTIRMVNNAPVAGDTAITVTENASYTGTLPAATDADGDAVTYSLSTRPTRGTVTVAANGTFTYTPDSGFSGSDQFGYEVTDGPGTSTYTVSVTVEPINHAPVAGDGLVTTHHGVPVTLDSIFGDPDGDPLTFTTDRPSDGGSFTADANGTVTFTPRAGFVGEATVGYTVTDASGLSAGATITVVVTNGPVVARPDVYSGDDTVYSGNVLDNDIDSDRDPITVVDHTLPSRGTLVLAPDGTFTYTPEPGVSGVFEFTYTVSDGADFQIASVRFTVAAVGKPPLSAPDAADVEAGETVVIDVLGNDSDPNGDGLYVMSIGGPTYGSVYVNESGHLEYTADPDFIGVETFTYTVANGWGERTETVRVTVRASTVPVTVDDAVTVRAGESTVIDALANDRIPKGATVVVSSPPYNGTVRFDEVTGTFVYTPGEEVRRDGFTYTVTDALGRSSSAWVGVTVDQAPYANDDYASTPINEAVVIDVRQNDYDSEEGWLEVRVISQPEHGGKAVAQKDGTVIFTPDKGFQGYVEFSYSITDAVGNTATATVGVNVYDPTPFELDKKYTVGKDKTITVTAELGLLSNTVYAEYGKARLYEKPRNGTVQINLDGSFTYTPNQGFVGEDSFVFSLDGGQFGDGATAFITVTPDGPGDEAGYGDAVALTFDSAMGACWDSWMPWQRGPGSEFLGCLYPEARPEET